jgi:hypothetical protein
VARGEAAGEGHLAAKGAGVSSPRSHRSPLTPGARRLTSYDEWPHSASDGRPAG